MKKIFTLALALVAFSAASFAQSREAGRDVVLGKSANGNIFRSGSNNSNNGTYDNDRDGRYDRNDNNNSNARYDERSWERRRSDEVARINRDFDNRIDQVRNDRRLRNKDAKRQVQSLEAQRRQELNAVSQRYEQARSNAQGNGYDRNNGNNRDYRSNDRNSNDYRNNRGY